MKITMYSTTDAGIPETVGEIVWDGTRMVPTANVPFLKAIADALMLQPDPVAAMKTLPLQYKNGYMYAELDE